MQRERMADLVLRAGLAFAFLYPPLDAIANPDAWIGYFPHVMRGSVPDQILLHSFGIIEVIIALWILSGWKIFWPSIIAALMLLAIVSLDFGDFEVIFRDVSIASMAIYLAIRNFPTGTRLSS